MRRRADMTLWLMTPSVLVVRTEHTSTLMKNMLPVLTLNASRESALSNPQKVIQIPSEPSTIQPSSEVSSVTRSLICLWTCDANLFFNLHPIFFFYSVLSFLVFLQSVLRGFCLIAVIVRSMSRGASGANTSPLFNWR